MNARLERKLRLLGVVVAVSVIGAIAFVLAQGLTSVSAIEVGISYGLIISVALGGIELFVLAGPMRVWLSGLSFAARLYEARSTQQLSSLPSFFSWVRYLPGSPSVRP
jgi:adenylate cyclase